MTSISVPRYENGGWKEPPHSVLGYLLSQREGTLFQQAPGACTCSIPSSPVLGTQDIGRHLVKNGMNSKTIKGQDGATVTQGVRTEHRCSQMWGEVAGPCSKKCKARE